MPPDTGILDAQVALAGAILAMGTAAFAPITVMWARRYFPLRRVVQPPWGFGQVALAALVYLSFMMLFAGAFSVGLGLESGDSLPVEVSLVIVTLTGAAVCTMIFYWAHRRDPSGVRCLGLWRCFWTGRIS